VLAHRERSGGFESLDELDSIPGFPRAFLEELKSRLAV
jgi:DNA uptake protein ComE-like DNA-binding protein